MPVDDDHSVNSKTVDSSIKKMNNPAQSVAAAFGIGIVPGIVVGLALREMERKRLEEDEAGNLEAMPDEAPHNNVASLIENNYNKYTFKEFLSLIGGMPSLEEQIKGLFLEVPEGYEARQAELAKINHLYRQLLAEQLAPVLNAKIQAMPHDTYEEKKTLAKWVNAEVERFGLAVKCPKTGLPATFRGHTGNWAEIGRFGFEVYIDGKRKVSAYSDKLPELQLIDVTPSQKPETPTVESEIPWQDEVRPKSTRSGRKLS